MTSVFGYCKGDPNIPIDELDYGFIEKCKDINKLQKILEILRSGEEGRYPALEQFTEKQLAKKKPDSPLLEKCSKEKTMQDVPKDDIRKTVEEINNLSTIHPVTVNNESADGGGYLPPIRSTKSSENVIQEMRHEVLPDDPNEVKKTTTLKTPEYWEKLSKQVETEDNDFDKICKEKTSKSHLNVTSSKPVHELLTQYQVNKDKSNDPNVSAQYEKNKGNEAFRCGDYKEALTYYNRSLDILPTAASYNNRAITLIKLEQFKEAIHDCDHVISIEPNNIKAYMRRGIANQSLDYADKALIDFTKVVELEPSNKRGKELMEKITKELDKQKLSPKKKGKRMKIEEINTNGIKESSEENVNIDSMSSVDNVQDNVQGNVQDNHVESRTQKDTNNKQSNDKDYNDNEVKSSNSITSSVNNMNETNTDEVYVNENNKRENINFHKGNTVHNTEININSEDSSIHSSKSNEQVVNCTYKSAREVNEEAVIKELPADVVDMKNKGNTLYKSGQYDKASEMYTFCINALIENKSDYKMALATLFSNRSSCQMKMGNCKHCIFNCDKSIELLQSAKVYLKRAIAYESLEKYIDAYVDYQNVLKLDPISVNALQAFSRLGKVLRSQYGDEWRGKLHDTDPLPVVTKSLNTNVTKFNVDNKAQSQLTSTETLEENIDSKSCSDVAASVLKIAENVTEKFHVITNDDYVENKDQKSSVVNDDECKVCEDEDSEPAPTTSEDIEHAPRTNIDAEHAPGTNEEAEHDPVTDVDAEHDPVTDVDAEHAPGTNEDAEHALKTNVDIEHAPNTNVDAEHAPVTNEDAEHAPRINVKAKHPCEDETKESKGTANVDNDTKRHDFREVNISKEKLAKEMRILEFFETKEKGNHCVQSQQYKEAAVYYTKCVELLPNEIPSYTNRALCYLKLQQPDKAIEDCSQALKLQPSCVKALFRRAQATKMTKKYKEALADLTKVLKIEPNNNAAKKEMESCKAEFYAELRNIQAQNEAAKLKDLTGKSKKVPIEEILSDSAEFAVKGKMSTKVGKCPLAKGNTSRPSQLKKMTGFEFLHAWNNVKSDKTADYADLLLQIDAFKLPDLLSNKLDGEILKNFIRTVNEHFTNKETYKHGIQLLKALCKVSRFVTMLMFLNTTEKTLLRCTIDLLENKAKQSNEKTLLSDINGLRTSYRCP